MTGFFVFVPLYDKLYIASTLHIARYEAISTKAGSFAKLKFKLISYALCSIEIASYLAMTCAETCKLLISNKTKLFP